MSESLALEPPISNGVFGEIQCPTVSSSLVPGRVRWFVRSETGTAAASVNIPECISLLGTQSNNVFLGVSPRPIQFFLSLLAQCSMASSLVGKREAKCGATVLLCVNAEQHLVAQPSTRVSLGITARRRRSLSTPLSQSPSLALRLRRCV